MVFGGIERCRVLLDSHPNAVMSVNISSGLILKVAEHDVREWEDRHKDLHGLIHSRSK